MDKFAELPRDTKEARSLLHTYLMEQLTAICLVLGDSTSADDSWDKVKKQAGDPNVRAIRVRDVNVWRHPASGRRDYAGRKPRVGIRRGDASVGWRRETLQVTHPLSRQEACSRPLTGAGESNRARLPPTRVSATVSARGRGKSRCTRA